MKEIKKRMKEREIGRQKEKVKEKKIRMRTSIFNLAPRTNK